MKPKKERKSLIPRVRTPEGEILEFKDGHPDVNREFDYLLADWYRKYSSKIMLDEKKKNAQITTAKTKNATIISTVDSYLKDLINELKYHSKPFTPEDKEMVDILKDRIKRSQSRVVFLDNLDEKMLDLSQEIRERLRDLAEIRELRRKSIFGLTEEEKKRLKELESKYSDEEVLWPVLVVKDKKTNRIELETVGVKGIIRDIMDKESAASKFLDVDTILGKDPFYMTFEKLLKVDEAGKADKPTLRKAYAEAIKALTLYRFRDAISSRHYVHSINLIKKRLGDKLFNEIVNEMEKSPNVYDRDVAKAVKVASRYTRYLKRSFRRV